MGQDTYEQLSRRERQIMDVVFRDGEATVASVRESIPDPPSYSAVRATMGILERKGHLRHRKDGARYVYLPQVSRQRARRTALGRLIDTFFEGAPEKALAALIRDDAVSDEELARMEALISEARKSGR